MSRHRSTIERLRSFAAKPFGLTVARQVQAAAGVQTLLHLRTATLLPSHMSSSLRLSNSSLDMTGFPS